ncbi:MAG: capsule assembly Wzi family protein [Bacteroidota bacterium]
MHPGLTRSFLGLLLLTALAASPAWAQADRLVPVGSWHYDVIVRLQQRGHLLTLPPTALPYTQGDIAEAVAQTDTTTLHPVERRWLHLLRRALRRVSERVEAPTVRWEVALDGGGQAANTERPHVLRPLGEIVYAYPYGQIGGAVQFGPLVAELRTRHDLFYNDDPDGLDTALRAAARSDHTYVGARGTGWAVRLGRFAQHWGVHGETATVISSNPRTYDQLSLRLGGDRLFVHSLLGELDSATQDGRFTGTAGDDSVRVGSDRRFVAAHRWTWRPSPRLSVSLQESALFSGPGTGFSLKYLNPVHPFVYVVDNRPKNDENNGMVGLLLWGQHRRWTVHGQLLFDDLDLLGIGNEPPSIAATASLHRGAWTPILDAGVRATLVTLRTYNAGQPQGRYLYLLRGLATQFSDYVEAEAYARVLLDAWLPGLEATPYLAYLEQGDRDIRQPFPPKDSPVGWIFDGPTTQTWRPGVRLLYQASPWWWVRADLGLNRSQLEGTDATMRAVGLLEVGFRLQLDGTYSIAF